MLYNIEFLRFIFTIAIIIGHAISFSKQEIAFNYIGNPGFCVELFFIIAGYFLFYDIKKQESNLNFTTKDFAIKKFARLMPVFVFACIMQILFYAIGLIEQKFYFKYEFLNMLFIREIGINSFSLVPLRNDIYSTNTNVWFIGPMFWTSLLFFYTLRNFDKKKVHLTIIILIFLSFVLYCRTSLQHPLSQLARAISGIGIGYFLAIFCDWYKNNCNPNLTIKKNKIIFTILELLILLEIFNTIFKKQYSLDLNLYFMILFCVLLFSFVFNKGYIGQFLNNKFFGFMGKYCYSIYILQYIVQITIGKGNKLMSTIWYSNFRNNYPNLDLIISILIIIVFGIIAYYLVEQPFKKYIEKKFIQK